MAGRFNDNRDFFCVTGAGEEWILNTGENQDLLSVKQSQLLNFMISGIGQDIIEDRKVFSLRVVKDRLDKANAPDNGDVFVEKMISESLRLGLIAKLL